MSKKLALVLGTTILTVTLAVLGLAVWRVGDLRTVLERPRAAGNTGVIQGCKQTAGLVACDNTANNLARNAEVRMDGGSLQTSQPYSFQNLAAGSTHTVSVTPISGYATEYVYCYNSIMDYTTNPYGCKQGGQVIGVATRASGGSVSVTVPSSPDPTIGYSLVDLHWWFAPTVAKTCSVSLSSASIATGQSVNVTTTGSGGTVETIISRTDSGTIPFGRLVYTDSAGHKYYDITGTATLTGLTAGAYKVFCSIASEPNKCTGNPFCAYEGANPGIQECEGWVSCSGSDNAGLTVTAAQSSVPNCSNLSGPTTLTVGQAGTYTASFYSQVANSKGRIDIADATKSPAPLEPPWGSPQNYVDSKETGVVAGNSGTGSISWTPTTAGTYFLYCRAWNDGIAECRGDAAYVDGPPRYTCAGPNASMTMTVTAAPQAV